MAGDGGRVPDVSEQRPNGEASRSGDGVWRAEVEEARAYARRTPPWWRWMRARLWELREPKNPGIARRECPECGAHEKVWLGALTFHTKGCSKPPYERMQDVRAEERDYWRGIVQTVAPEYPVVAIPTASLEAISARAETAEAELAQLRPDPASVLAALLAESPDATVAALEALLGERADMRPFPMQDGPPIPWCVAEAIHTHLYRYSQSLEDVGRRGGFGWPEVGALWNPPHSNHAQRVACLNEVRTALLDSRSLLPKAPKGDGDA